MTRLDLVRKALTNSDIAAWYATYPVSPESFNAQNVREWGLNGMAEVAQIIIKDGFDAGTLTREDVAEEFNL